MLCRSRWCGGMTFLVLMVSWWVVRSTSRLSVPADDPTIGLSTTEAEPELTRRSS